MSVPLPMTFTSFNMDRPLNKAHWHERTAEVQLKERKWDDAEKSYSLAAEMMKKALDEVSSTTMAVPLQMQVTQLEKMKCVVDIKRQEASRNKSETVSPKSPHSSPKGPSTVTSENDIASGKKVHKEAKRHENTLDKCTETSQIKKTPKTFKQHSPPNTWQVVPKDLIQMVHERENDSLLQFLHLPIGNEEEKDGLTSSMRKKRPKSQDAILEEYKTRFSLLQATAVALIKALDDSEKENTSLKSQVEELTSEVMTLNERLEVYEENRNFTPLHYNDEDVPPDDIMTASMLINQPESYFEFERKDLESELRDATKDSRPTDERRKPTSSTVKGNASRKGPSLLADNLSVQYEDLDDGLSTETFSNSGSDISSKLGSSQL